MHKLVRVGVKADAVQAATGSTRHISLQALMTLQLQLCLHKADGTDAALNNRLSRIVTKLFGRVIKAEEGGEDPFFNPNVDVEALLCSIEDLLVACNDADNKSHTSADRSLSECKNMGKSLVSALLKSKKNSGGSAASVGPRLRIQKSKEGHGPHSGTRR